MTPKKGKKNDAWDIRNMPQKVVDKFKVRDETVRSKFLMLLAANLGKQLPVTEVLDHVYGKRKGSTKAYNNLRSSVEAIIKRKKLGYEIVWQKGQRGATVGLYEYPSKVITSGGTLAALNPKGRLESDNGEVT